MPIKRDKEGVIIEITLTDDEEEELDEEAAARKKKEEEDAKTEVVPVFLSINHKLINLLQQKEREAFLEMIHVMIAFIIIMAMAAGTVALKLYLFPDETIQGFKPMKQQVMVMMMVCMVCMTMRGALLIMYNDIIYFIIIPF